MPTPVLALFAKAPVAGEVKTRLTPALAPEEAARLYEAMLLDILDQHRAGPPAARVVWYTPPDALPWFSANVPDGYRLRPQQGPDLGARMAHLFRAHRSEGYDRILLRGTDSPTLPPERVPDAIEALDRADLVLCPDRDGGYNLIGMREPCDRLFTLRLGHGGVLEQTLERARDLGLRTELLPPHHDVDTAEDLERLAPELSDDRTPRTLARVRTLRPRPAGH